MIQFVLIPCEPSAPLQSLAYDPAPPLSCNNGDGQDLLVHGDTLPQHLISAARSQGDKSVEVDVTPIRRMTEESRSGNFTRGYDAGVLAYSYRNFTDAAMAGANVPNIRATSLFMACGLYSRRFYGDVYVGRFGYDSSGKVRNLDLTVGEIFWGCISPDLRVEILSALRDAHVDSGEEGESFPTEECVVPQWLVNASMENYKDGASLSALASVMALNEKDKNSVEDDDDEEESSTSDDSAGSDNSSNLGTAANDEIHLSVEAKAPTSVTLCLHCRGPCESLCQDCEGAYFCGEPRRCKKSGWSHRCMCKTWHVYSHRRAELSHFPFEWHRPMMERPFQTSEMPYKMYLKETLKVLDTGSTSFWTTEVDGWSAGLSGSARTVDAAIRRSYHNGFQLDSRLLPPERHVTDDDCEAQSIGRDECCLPQIQSWKDYYALRCIPLESPVALLLTFPLTIFHALRRYGAVPITVSRMLHRPLRLHVLGVEKELNFLDLFKELGYILPEDLEVELVFVVRQDMLPPKCQNGRCDQGYDMRVDLTSNLTLLVKSGTYGDDLLPNFDVGSGPPDMIIGINAGLFAYESWRSVVSYIHANRNIVAVFTDYNEHSGVNCASLGGGQARESLSINPFRQPRAMPVYCMNLPQFSNGFMYVFNEQELE